VNISKNVPLLTSQTLTVMSYDADASLVELCEKATEVTVSLWPAKVCRHAPVLTSQILMVLSLDADASLVESCEKAIELIMLLWPSSVCRHALQPVLIAGLMVTPFGSS
jgi:hypothetical protein